MRGSYQYWDSPTDSKFYIDAQPGQILKVSSVDPSYKMICGEVLKVNLNKVGTKAILTLVCEETDKYHSSHVAYIGNSYVEWENIDTLFPMEDLEL